MATHMLVVSGFSPPQINTTPPREITTDVTKNGHDSWGPVQVFKRFLSCQKPLIRVLATIVSFSNRTPYKKIRSHEFKTQLCLLLTVGFLRKLT